MFCSDHIELWNLHPGCVVQTGSQPIFNVVGRIRCPGRGYGLCYVLNGGVEKEVFFNCTDNRLGRLENRGDFNIDTICVGALLPKNRLVLRVYNDAGILDEMSVPFFLCSNKQKSPSFDLGLNCVAYPQQVGQVVDGKWQVNRDRAGETYLEVKAEDAGLDRIVLFGDQHWTTGYEVKARLCVTAWTGLTHNVGLVFKWNPHLQGNGRCLPTRWSTGLAYYYSHCPGLRIRFGVDVHLDDQGNKIGDYILKETELSPWLRKTGWFANRVLDRLLGMQYPFSQVIPNTQYWFRLQVHPAQYTLAVWKAGRKEPVSQVVVPHPIDRLPTGSVGVIAYNCGVRIYDFKVVSI